MKIIAPHYKIVSEEGFMTYDTLGYVDITYLNLTGSFISDYSRISGLPTEPGTIVDGYHLSEHELHLYRTHKEQWLEGLLMVYEDYLEEMFHRAPFRSLRYDGDTMGFEIVSGLYIWRTVFHDTTFKFDYHLDEIGDTDTSRPTHQDTPKTLRGSIKSWFIKHLHC